MRIVHSWFGMTLPEDDSGCSKEVTLPEDDSGCPKEDSTFNRIPSYLRLRPINKLERSKRSRHCIQIQRENKKVRVDSNLNGTCEFSFDGVSNIIIFPMLHSLDSLIFFCDFCIGI